LRDTSGLDWNFRHRSSIRLLAERRLPRAKTGDSAFYVAVIQEDGYQAWSSPIYAIP